jgi:hypothetical protein
MIDIIDAIIAVIYQVVNPCSFRLIRRLVGDSYLRVMHVLLSDPASNWIWTFEVKGQDYGVRHRISIMTSTQDGSFLLVTRQPSIITDAEADSLKSTLFPPLHPRELPSFPWPKAPK